MNWMADYEAGDVFRWCRERDDLCRITHIRDDEINFVHITGPHKGMPGYTLPPQDVELVSAVELLGLLAKPG